MVRMMQMVLVCIGIGLIGTVCTGCGQYRWQNFETSTMPNGPGEIQSIIEYGRIYIYASINGNEPELFLFDTGASIHSITPEAAQRNGLTESSHVYVLDANNNRLRIPSGTADRVEFGPIVQTGVHFTIQTKNSFQIKKLAGTIGFNGLQGFTTDINYPQSRISITNERLDEHDPTARRYISYDHEMVYMPVEIGSVANWSTAWSLLDTGGSGNLWLDDKQSQILTEIDHAKRVDRAVGAHGIPWIISEASIIGSVHVGSTIIEGLRATVNAKGNNIGMGILQNFHIKIDGVSKLVSLEHREQSRRLIWWNHFGLEAIENYTGSWRPLYVVPGGLAEALGMTYNDKIFLINGKQIPDGSHSSRYYPISDDAQAVTLRIVRDGQEMDVVFPLVDSIKE